MTDLMASGNPVKASGRDVALPELCIDINLSVVYGMNYGKGMEDSQSSKILTEENQVAKVGEQWGEKGEADKTRANPQSITAGPQVAGRLLILLSLALTILSLLNLLSR